MNASSSADQLARDNPESKHDVLLDSLRKFYAEPGHLRLLSDVLNNEAGISLRILDWLVTNYSKKKNIVYFVDGTDGYPAAFNMFLEYKSQLKAYSKRFFDPFCRRERLGFVDSEGRDFQTTLGQLNFFRWAITNGVVDFGAQHAADIEADMMQSIKHRYGDPAAPKPRRKELSKAAIKSCTKTVLHVTVRFT
jgi:hypothetical protein